MLSCLELFLHRKSDFTFRHRMTECSAHALFVNVFCARISYDNV